MVEVYLNVYGSQISFLSILRSDVQRLSVRPFKWLRFVMFSICGARGDLSAMQDGPPVEYESDALDDDVTFLYKPSGICIFVDYRGLNDRMTSTNQTDRRVKFRQDVLERDGSFCIITKEFEENCDAAHLVPMGKGDEYIKRVVEDRSPLYGGTVPSISRVNAVENGVLLNKPIHMLLGKGYVAFLKTPNYGLDPTDVQRVDQRPTDMDLDHFGTDHFTLQHLKEPAGYNPVSAAALAATRNLHSPHTLFVSGSNVDALFQGTGSSLPPAVILDYVYGVAAYNRWDRRDNVHSVESYSREHSQVFGYPPAGLRVTIVTTLLTQTTLMTLTTLVLRHSRDATRPQGGGT